MTTTSPEEPGRSLLSRLPTMSRNVVLLVAAVAIAALGAGLVLLYVSSLAGAATADQQMVKVLTATSTISPGETAAVAKSDGRLALTEVPKSSLVAGAVTSVRQMSGEVSQVTIFPGEQILAQMFATSVASGQNLPIPHGKLAISVELSDPGRVAGFVPPGAHVAIFISVQGTSTDATGSQSYTRIMVPNAEVLAVGPATVLSAGGSSSAATTSDPVPQTILTVALSQHDADRVLFASNSSGSSTGGTLAFGLLGSGTAITPDPGVTARDLLN